MKCGKDPIQELPRYVEIVIEPSFRAGVGTREAGLILKRFAAALFIATLIQSTAGIAPAAPVAAIGTKAPPRYPEMGVQFHAMWSDYTNAQRKKVLDKMAAAGVKWVRVDVGWSSLQEEGRDTLSQWQLDLLDNVVKQARSRHIKVLATLWRTPDWANAGAGVLAPPLDATDYGNVAELLARRYEGRIAAWEVWNEPNLRGFFTGDPADYVALLKSAYAHIKRGDPNATVVLGAPSYNDTGWLEKIYEAGAAGHFDVMATHPYQGMADYAPDYPDDGNIWWLTHTPAVRDLMKKYGDGDKKIWFTEFGWSSHPNEEGVENWKRGVSLQQQGRYLVRTLKLVARNYPYVTKVFWYNERNRDSGDVQLDNYGLLNRDLSPKPAYRMMKRFLLSVGR